jgi:dephospho-CoA kinase
MIIGLTGTFGAGKGETSKIFMEMGYNYHSCSDVLRAELRTQGKEETIANLAELGNELRDKFGSGELAKRLIAIIRKRGEQKAIIDSIRSVGEVEELKKEPDFYLLSIEAPLAVRHERVKRRGRHGDNLEFEEFKRLEQAQMHGEGARQNLQKCMELADFRISNSGTLEELKTDIKGIVAEVEKVA